jgi:chorismate mutase-like protein
MAKLSAKVRVFALTAAIAILPINLAVSLRAADGSIQPQSVQSDDSHLVDLMAQRLDLAREVAWTKFQSGAPISDPARENALIHDLAARAVKAGFSTSGTLIFFSAQIAASRQVQAELIDAWKRGAPRPTTKQLDLKIEIRPRLDAVSDQLLSAFLARPDWLNSPARLQAARLNLISRGFSAAVASLATPGLL